MMKTKAFMLGKMFTGRTRWRHRAWEPMRKGAYIGNFMSIYNVRRCMHMRTVRGNEYSPKQLVDPR